MIEKVEILLGSMCNNKCLFCSLGDTSGFKESEQVEREVVEALEKFKPEELCFTGGEPTIRRDLTDLIKMAREKGAERVTVATNGRMFSNKEFALKAVESGMTDVAVSLHSTKPEVHDFLVNVKGCFEQTIKGISNLKELGTTIKTNSVITSLNYMELPEMVDFFYDECGASFSCIVFPFIEGFLKKNLYLVPSLEELRKPLLEATRRAKDRGKTIWPLNVPLCLFGNNFGDPRCLELKTEMYWYSGSKDLDENLKEKCTKLPECGACKYREYCPGVQKEYLLIKGKKGIKPVRG